MKNPIDKLNKSFESRVRLGIMSILMVNDRADFNGLKETLEVTDGNLASHLTALEKEGFINVRKSFLGRKPHTSYAVTRIGERAFKEHLNALESLLKKR